MRWKQDGRSLIVETPAKLNLFLEILGKRNDGFHELETLMVTVDWYDSLRFTLRDDTSRSPLESRCPPHPDDSDDGFRLTCFAADQKTFSAGTLPAGSDNLIIKAAKVLKAHSGTSRPVEIELLKRIPLAAGLAGGSGNAAGALWALNRLWGLCLPNEELQSLGSRLGSDIAFFLNGASSAVCRGRGEIVEPTAIPAGLHFVIARPASGLFTAEVYRHCRPSPRPQSVARLVESLQSGRWDRAGTLLHNALQEPAERLNQEVCRLKTLFQQEPVLGHRMSGSGTAWFGLCSSREQARRTAARLKALGVPHVAVVRSRS